MVFFDQYRNRWIIIILIILNLLLLAVVFGVFFRPPTPTGILRRELKMDRAQMEALRPFRDRYYEETGNLRDSIRAKKRIMFQTLSRNPQDTTTVNDMVEQIGRLNERIEWVLIRHYGELQRILNPGQLERLDEAFQRSLQPRPGPPPPRK